VNVNGDGPRILAYSHDGYGLGHLRRNVRIVSGLRKQRPEVDALLVTGAKAAATVVSRFGLEWLRLPAVAKVGKGRYETDEHGYSSGDIIAYRASMIADAVRTFRPDIVLVDRYPLGLRDELSPAFNILRRDREIPAVLGLRDILDDADTVKEEWATAGHSQRIRDLYHSVLIYGDRSVYDPVSQYQMPDDIADLTTFTGYLADDFDAADSLDVRNRFAPPGGRLVVCTLGGGKDAYQLAETFLSAARRLSVRGWNGLLVTGPYMSDEDVARLHAHPMATSIPIIEMVQDVPSHLAAADAVVCMGGYNTMCEVLALAVPAVAIPRTQPRQEQLMRCERFAARGLISILPPDRLSDGALAEAVLAVSESERGALGERCDDIARTGIEVTSSRLASLLPTAVGSRST
jgi:predicted glycosyltransferase